MDVKPNALIMLSSNHAIKVIKATARITPGIAQPEIDKVDKMFKNLFFKTLLPQLEIKEKVITVSNEDKDEFINSVMIELDNN